MLNQKLYQLSCLLPLMLSLQFLKLRIQLTPIREGSPGCPAKLHHRGRIVKRIVANSITEFGRKFRRAAGLPESLSAEATRQDSNWLQGTRAAATVFG